jgi:hypothetical protein
VDIIAFIKLRRLILTGNVDRMDQQRSMKRMLNVRPDGRRKEEGLKSDGKME